MVDAKYHRNSQAYFLRSFADPRDKVDAKQRLASDHEAAAEIADIHFRDFRRTCVVIKGQQGIPEHLISAMLTVDLTTECAPIHASRLRPDAPSALEFQQKEC